MGLDNVVSRHTISMGIPCVDSWLTDPQILGRHNITWGRCGIASLVGATYYRCSEPSRV